MATDQSALSGLSVLGFPDAAIQLIGANNSYGNNLEDTSMMSLYRVMGEFGRLSGPALAVKEATQGNMRLPEAMARALVRPVEMGEPVAAIRQSSSETRVSLASGGNLDADAVIVTLPLPALQQIDMELPAAQAQFWTPSTITRWFNSTVLSRRLSGKTLAGVALGGPIASSAESLPDRYPVLTSTT